MRAKTAEKGDIDADYCPELLLLILCGFHPELALNYPMDQIDFHFIM